jgi:hypothetical protein
LTPGQIHKYNEQKKYTADMTISIHFIKIKKIKSLTIFISPSKTLQNIVVFSLLFTEKTEAEDSTQRYNVYEVSQRNKKVPAFTRRHLGTTHSQKFTTILSLLNTQQSAPHW